MQTAQLVISLTVRQIRRLEDVLARHGINRELEKKNFLRGKSFLCHVFSVRSVQNLRTFWRTTQNLLILALLCSLYSKQTLKVHLGVEKHIER